MKSKLVLLNDLKRARKLRYLSQTELAKLVGVSRNTISSIETGVYYPSARLALLLCKSLNFRFEDLFYF